MCECVCVCMYVPKKKKKCSLFDPRYPESPKNCLLDVGFAFQTSNVHAEKLYIGKCERKWRDASRVGVGVAVVSNACEVQ